MKYLFLLCVPLLFSSCEQIVPADGLPYADHIVVRGMLIAGEPLDSISVTHTLPLTASYDRTDAAIPSATVTVSVDGQSIPLTYIGNGYFGDPKGTVVQSGKSYSIDVRWNGMHAAASTTVPEPPVVDSSFLGDRQVRYYSYGGYPPDSSVYYPLLIGVRANPNDSYALVSDSMNVYFADHHVDEQTDGRSYLEPAIAPPDSARAWLDFSFGGGILSTVDSVQMTATLASFDRAYYEFWRTYDEYQDNSPFGNTGKNAKWNVSGDGIGIFIGEARSRTQLFFK